MKSKLHTLHTLYTVSRKNAHILLLIKQTVIVKCETRRRCSIRACAQYGPPAARTQHCGIIIILCTRKTERRVIRYRTRARCVVTYIVV